MDIGAWDGCAALARAFAYATTLGAVGGGLFVTYTADSGGAARVLRPVAMLAVAALLLTVLKFPLLAGSLGGLKEAVDPAMLKRVSFTGEGTAALGRACGLALLCAATTQPGRARPPLLWLGALLAAGSFAATGHVHARHSAVLAGLLVLHVGCAAFWIGALWPLERALTGEPARASVVVARFSRLALAAVPVLLFAGGVLLVQLLGSVSALWSSGYGRWLCLKLALVCGLLALAAFNRLRLTPRLQSADGRRALRMSIRAELILAAGVLAVTAALTTFTGPDE